MKNYFFYIIMGLFLCGACWIVYNVNQTDEETSSTTTSNETFVFNEEEHRELGQVGDYTLYGRTDYHYHYQSEICMSCREFIFEDEDYKYYLYEPISDHFILQKDDETLTLIEALEQGKITMNQLSGLIYFHKEVK